MPEIVVTVSPDMAYMNSIYTMIEEVLAKLNAGKKDLFDVKLAVSEGVTNAIMHAETMLKIKIVYDTVEARVDFYIYNDGGTFNPTGDDFKMPDIYEEHRRGLYLMNSYMDDIGYSEIDNGTMLHLMKRIRR